MHKLTYVIYTENYQNIFLALLYINNIPSDLLRVVKDKIKCTLNAQILLNEK